MKHVQLKWLLSAESKMQNKELRAAVVYIYASCILKAENNPPLTPNFWLHNQYVYVNKIIITLCVRDH